QERGRSIFCLRRRELASTSFSRCLKWGTSGRARTADGGGYMTIRHDYRFARASWRALAAALAAASLTLPALAQEAAPAAQAASPTMGVPAWGLASPDLEADPAVRFGRLDNGMRYAIQHHEMPQ